MHTGGVSKSMVSLLNIIDRQKYEISLMLVSPEGAFMELLPRDIRILSNPKWSALTGHLNGFISLAKSGSLLLALGHFIRLIFSGLGFKALAARSIATMMPPIDEEFDTIVDFNGQQQLYYMIDKLKARKKVTFFHSDYEKWPFYYNADKKYYPLADYIFTISGKCVESMKKYFPEQSGKIRLMENISSIDVIDRMAEENIKDMTANSNTLLTVGHVCENKGILLAIEAASILKSKGIDFHWYFLGSIDKPAEYSNLILKKGLTANITFLNIRTNPYPYIKNATIIVHPSKFEGRSIALDEAKLLCKPIVVTNFSTVNDQLTNRVNASICQMNPPAIAHSIEELLKDDELRQNYANKLVVERLDNSSEIEKLYHIFDE